MDPSQVAVAISQLSALFPNKSEDYLRRQYRRCKYDLTATIQKIESKINNPKSESVFGSFFNSIFNGFATLCGCGSSTSSENFIFQAEEEAVDVVELNIGQEFAKNLTEKFGESSLDLPRDFKPVIEIPVAVAQQLYAAYVESVLRQQEAQNKSTKNLVREDEAFARRLQDKEENEAVKWKLRAEKKTHFVDFKEVTDLPQIHGQDVGYQEQVEKQVPIDIFKEEEAEAFTRFLLEKRKNAAATTVVPKFIGNIKTSEDVEYQEQTQNQVTNDLFRENEMFAEYISEEKKKYVTTLKEKPSAEKKTVFEELPQVHEVDENDLALVTSEHPATFYREEAQRHLKKRKQFYKQAQQCLKANDQKRVKYYFQQAKKETKLVEKNNNRAAEAFVIENTGGRKYTIDLHHLYVKEAIDALDDFLDDEILDLEDENIHSRSLNVITGRGKHSVDGIPKIKPAVIKRLNKRRLKYFELNPGQLKVTIYKKSLLTNELN